MFKVYNTATKKKEEFVPVKKGEVGMYSCGPTVYDVSHIGNLSSFIFADVIRRWLEFLGYKVISVLNITDVEDKIIRNCFKTMSGLKSYTAKYEKLLMDDLHRLKIKPMDFYPRATEHVKEMVELIKVLIEKGHAYKKDGSVYYKISSFPDYGKFAGLDLKNLKIGASVDTDEYKKEDARDFVLWKGWKSDEDGNVYWDTEIGRGRPGWHIECSAMCMKYLGTTVDIHTGGVDLIFPHHQNEIAQSEGATGKQFVRYWMHREFLKISGDKMSKSAGTGASLLKIAPTPLDIAAFRYLIVVTHYRSPLHFSMKSLDSARKTVSNLRNTYSRLSGIKTPGDNMVKDSIALARKKFLNAMNDDLNTSKASSALFELLNEAEKLIQGNALTRVSAQAILAFMREVDQVFSVIVDESIERDLTEEETRLIGEREAARKNKDWKLADKIRDQLLEMGVVVEDTANGTRHFFV